MISPFPGTLGDVAAPSFALVLALMCGGEQKVVWLETIAFCWVFRRSSPLNSLTSEEAWESMAGSRGVGSNHLFQQQLLLKFSQNNHATTINHIYSSMVPPLWGVEYERSNALPGWAPSQGQIAKTNRFLHLPSGS